VKALAALTEEAKIQVKLFGKVKIYLADQSKFEVPDEQALEKLDAEIQALSAEVKTALAEKAEVVENRTRLEATPTDSSLKASVLELEKTTAALKQQLAECKKADAGGGSRKGNTTSLHALVL